MGERRCGKQHQVVPQNFEPRSHFLLAQNCKRIVDFGLFSPFPPAATMSCFAFSFDFFIIIFLINRCTSTFSFCSLVLHVILFLILNGNRLSCDFSCFGAGLEFLILHQQFHPVWETFSSVAQDVFFLCCCLPPPSPSFLLDVVFKLRVVFLD